MVGGHPERLDSPLTGGDPDVKEGFGSETRWERKRMQRGGRSPEVEAPRWHPRSEDHRS